MLLDKIIPLIEIGAVCVIMVGILLPRTHLGISFFHSSATNSVSIHPRSLYYNTLGHVKYVKFFTAIKAALFWYKRNFTFDILFY